MGWDGIGVAGKPPPHPPPVVAIGEVTPAVRGKTVCAAGGAATRSGAALLAAAARRRPETPSGPALVRRHLNPGGDTRST
jgi:hypothetical protein